MKNKKQDFFDVNKYSMDDRILIADATRTEQAQISKVENQYVRYTGVNYIALVKDGQKQSSSPIQLIVSNETDKVKEYSIFGSNYNLNKPNFGSQEGVSVEPAQSNMRYDEILYWLLSKKIDVSTLRIVRSDDKEVEDGDQLWGGTRLSIHQHLVSGQSSTFPMRLTDHYDEKQEQKKILDINNFTEKYGEIRGDVSFKGEIMPNSKLVFIFFIQDEENDSYLPVEKITHKSTIHFWNLNKKSKIKAMRKFAEKIDNYFGEGKTGHKFNYECTVKNYFLFKVVKFSIYLHHKSEHAK